MTCTLQHEPHKLSMLAESCPQFDAEHLQSLPTFRYSCTAHGLMLALWLQIAERTVCYIRLSPIGDLWWWCCRFRLRTENGQVYPQASELASNITAVCTSIGPGPDTTTVFNICESGDDALNCMLPPGVVCKAAGEYKVPRVCIASKLLLVHCMLSCDAAGLVHMLTKKVCLPAWHFLHSSTYVNILVTPPAAVHLAGLRLAVLRCP